ncbi:hypothetical protein ACHAWF_011391 [Thalassiosira exigua]
MFCGGCSFILSSLGELAEARSRARGSRSSSPTMGANSSSEKNVDAATASAGSHPANYGFSNKEARHLQDLRRMVCLELQKSEQCMIQLIWRCSHLLALNSQLKSPSSSDSASDIEALLTQQSQPQLASAREILKKMEVLLSEFTSLNKMNAALEELFIKDDQFLENLSNILGINGDHRRESLDFVWNSCCSSGGASILASDLVKLCFHAATVVHCVLQEQSVDDGHLGANELTEERDVSSEESIIQSLENSLLEAAKDAQDDHRFGGYGDPASSENASAAAAIAEGRVTQRDFSLWQRKALPDMIFCSVLRFLHVLFFTPQFPIFQQKMKPFPLLKSSKEITSSHTRKKMKPGEIIPISSHVFGKNCMPNSHTARTLLSPPVFAFVSISTPKFGENWYRIFAGADDGWTFQSLEHSIMGYEGPTLLVMHAHSKQSKPPSASVVLGAYTASKWEKNKRDFFGTSDCFLFQLKPTMRVLKPLPKMGTRGGHYMYFHSNTNVNTTNPSRKDDFALGLGFGGTVRRPRLFVNSNLEECLVSHQDTSFEEGCLGPPPSDDPFASQTSSSTLHIDSLEIYAVGDEDTIATGFKAQYQHRDIADATLRNARTVDKAAFLGDMRNGVIETKAFAHRGQVDGRAHGCLKGEEDDKANGL